jgi:muramoyltetrapeptide carboxypeptidase LdcA involved in peptidoglycan recycling
LIQQPNFDGVRGMVIGRFQKASKMEAPLLEQIIKSKKELSRIPVIANVDFGHTEPKLTLPIGGLVKVSATKGQASIEIVEH